ncbi:MULTISPECIES: hypothetical protein [unclassified Roseitalea]|uniref:sodium:solute symporter family transporter n=1 Tax=unclassified Roseitalea TaxID=2639107 RepID=UPI00273D2EDF|nr:MULTISPECIES: hypothetical protein [unclassified Roseitalea]
MAALIAAIMSSLDSALNSAGTLVTIDFVKPFKPDLSDETLVKIGRVITGLAMVIGAVMAPLISNFESLFSYFQSSLSYVVPPIVVVYLLGLFVGWLNGNAAFWTILLGLVVGIPLFIFKEVTGLWDSWGLPTIHYTIMSSIMMVLGIVTHLGISAMTRRKTKEGVDELVWSGAETKQVFTQWERPIWLDRTLLSGILIACMAGFVIWFW